MEANRDLTADEKIMLDKLEKIYIRNLNRDWQEQDKFLKNLEVQIATLEAKNKTWNQWLSVAEVAHLQALRRFLAVRQPNNDAGNKVRRAWYNTRLHNFWSTDEQTAYQKITFGAKEKQMLQYMQEYEKAMLTTQIYNPEHQGKKIKALQKDIQDNKALNEAQRTQLGALIKSYKVHELKSERVKQMYVLQQNKSIENSVNVGANGSYCTCYDGEVFIAGDHMNAGATTNCKGGILSEIHGPHKKFAARKVICGVNATSIRTKLKVSKVCNAMRASWVEGYAERYKYMSNYMIDQMQRWGNIDEQTPGLRSTEMNKPEINAKSQFEIHNTDLRVENKMTRNSFFWPILKRKFTETLAPMLEGIRIWNKSGAWMKNPGNDEFVEKTLDYIDRVHDKNSLEVGLAWLGWAFQGHTKMFQDNMLKFSNIIEKAERRYADWLRATPFDSEDERVHPQKWIKFLGEKIDDWVSHRWQYGWQFCSNKLVAIMREVECTFRDYGYGPCYDSDLQQTAAVATATPTKRALESSTIETVTHESNKSRRQLRNSIREASTSPVFSASESLPFVQSTRVLKEEEKKEEAKKVEEKKEEKPKDVCVDADQYSTLHNDQTFLPQCCCKFGALPEDCDSSMRGDNCCYKQECDENGANCQYHGNPRCPAHPVNNKRMEEMKKLNSALIAQVGAAMNPTLPDVSNPTKKGYEAWRTFIGAQDNTDAKKLLRDYNLYISNAQRWRWPFKESKLRETKAMNLAARWASGNIAHSYRSNMIDKIDPAYKSDQCPKVSTHGLQELEDPN